MKSFYRLIASSSNEFQQNCCMHASLNEVKATLNIMRNEQELRHGELRAEMMKKFEDSQHDVMFYCKEITERLVSLEAAIGVRSWKLVGVSNSEPLPEIYKRSTLDAYSGAGGSGG